MVRAAIVGLGSWGQTLVDSVQGKCAEIRFTAAYTRTPANVEGFCRHHDILIAASFDELLADRAIDAVVLATPHSQHEEQIKQAAAAAWSYTHFLGYLLDAELRFRHQKTVRLNLQFANLPYQKRLQEFDFQQQPWIKPVTAKENPYNALQQQLTGAAKPEGKGK